MMISMMDCHHMAVEPSTVGCVPSFHILMRAQYITQKAQTNGAMHVERARLFLGLNSRLAAFSNSRLTLGWEPVSVCSKCHQKCTMSGKMLWLTPENMKMSLNSEETDVREIDDRHTDMFTLHD